MLVVVVVRASMKMYGRFYSFFYYYSNRNGLSASLAAEFAGHSQGGGLRAVVVSGGSA